MCVMKNISLMVVEDNRTYRESLLHIIELSEGLECIGDFNAAEPCLKSLQANPAHSPDLLLLDLNLPGDNGLTMLPLFRQIAPKTEVVILTQDDDYHSVLEALQLGANGYLLKGATVAEIRTIIREVSEGATYIDPQLSRFVMDALCRSGDTFESPLSIRESEVLTLLSQGYSKKEVAEKMGLSYHTVVSYVRTIFDKLESPNLAAAVAKAVRQKLI